MRRLVLFVGRRGGPRGVATAGVGFMHDGEVEEVLK